MVPLFLIHTVVFLLYFSILCLNYFKRYLEYKTKLFVFRVREKFEFNILIVLMLIYLIPITIFACFNIK